VRAIARFRSSSPRFADYAPPELRNPGARAQVIISYRDQDVLVEVTDDGRGAVTSASDGRAGTGHGLTGMRERVAAFNGDLEVGPRPDGGFRVAARLPIATHRR
jgi:signal transduction histidine kinase